MSSVVDICNLALSWLGEKPIISLDDEGDAAALCKANYAPLRDAVLESAEWTFATKRLRLTPISENDPVWADFGGSRFQIPPEVLRVIGVFQDVEMQPWSRLIHEQEDKMIIVRQVRTSIFIRGIVRVEDPNKFTPSFEQALAERMAWEMSIPVTNSPQIEQGKGQKYGIKVTDATALNGMNQTSKQVRASWLNRARNRGA